ncbi:MAG: hypothetical protein ACI9VS_000842 [Candidatus Binatia bacterium]|jgi:uncharacterized protein (DUF2062 family)
MRAEMGDAHKARGGDGRVKESFWRRRFVRPIVEQLTQGGSPQKIALTLAAGFALGVFPIIGATTLLCVVVGAAMKLNQPVIQAANWAAAGAQLPLILLFVRVGEGVVGAEPMPMNPSELVSEFNVSPSAFIGRFGLTGLHGILGWTLLVPVTFAGAFACASPIANRLHRKLQTREKQ